MIETDLIRSLSHFFFSGLPAVRRQVRWPRDQVFHEATVRVIQMFRNLHEKILNRINHYLVLLTDTESSDRLLGDIIIHRDFSVIKEYLQVSFLMNGVLESFSGLALLRHLREIFFYPRKISLHQQADAPLSAIPTFFCRETFQLFFLPIDNIISRNLNPLIYKGF